LQRARYGDLKTAVSAGRSLFRAPSPGFDASATSEETNRLSCVWVFPKAVRPEGVRADVLSAAARRQEAGGENAQNWGTGSVMVMSCLS
jgi:hypothetical protein